MIGNTDRNGEIVASLLTDSLVRYDAALNLKPLLARSWETSPDGLTWTFHLREGVKWHDGAPVTAQDVVFTLRKLREPATQARSTLSQFQDVVSIEALDPTTVRVVYSVPYADVLDAWNLPIIPEHVAGKDKDLLSGEFVRHPVGCGPFRFSHMDSSEIVLDANPDYWDGPPSIDGVVFRFMPSDRTAFQAFQREELDVMNATVDLWKESATAPRADPATGFITYPLSAWYVGWNQDGSNPFFGDPRVRRAMVLALDRPRFISKVLGDLARVGIGTWHPDSSWFDHTLEPWPFDPAQAGKLLDEAGWRDHDGDGVRDRDGAPFSFELMVVASALEITDRSAAWIQDSLGSIGVRVSILKLEWNAYRERRSAHQFQAFMQSLTFTPVPDQYELYHSSSRERAMNYVGFSDSEVDRLLVEGRRTFDPEARHAIYNQLQHRVHELEPVTVLFHFAVPVLHDARLLGLEPTPRSIYLISPGPRRWRWTTAPRRK